MHEKEKPFLGVNKEPCFFAFINEKVISHIVARPISHDYFVGTKALVTNFCNLKSAQKNNISFLNIFPYDFNYHFHVNCIGTHDCREHAACNMAQLMKQQKEDIRGALVNSGPYKLTGEYTHLQLTKEKWFAMTTEQRTAYEMAFDKSCLNEVTNKGIPEEALSSRL